MHQEGKSRRTATINMRVEPTVKRDAEAAFAKLGLTLPDAINVFLHKSIMAGGMPFEVRVQPNEETLMAMRETEDILAGRTQAKKYASARELFDELDAETDDETC